MRIEDCRLQIVLLLLVSGMVAGCSKTIDTVYGRRKGEAPKSVNGTAVLGEMFEAAGHDVYSWNLLSPRLRDRVDCIVWFPNDFEPPTEDVRDWLEVWLRDRRGRTLIYVGRDFDAAGWYWDKVKPDAPPQQVKRIEAAAAAVKDDFDIDRQAIPKKEDCQWFTVVGQDQPRKVRSLQGDRGWLEGIDPSKLELELRSRIRPAPTADALLESEGDLLIARELVTCEPWGESQRIVVANGSFLLNLPLVNHEHRKLAGKLIEEVGPPSKTVVFLESDWGGPPILDEEPSAEMPTGMEIFLRPPTSWILWHFAVAGIMFCFSRWPIIGLPRDLDRDDTSDFGKHILALAELLQRSRDRAYATTRLLHYRQTTKSNE